MVNIIINSDPRYNIDRSMIRSVVAASLQQHRITGKVELGVNIIGDRKMHQLNKEYRGIDSSTDILSFALEDAGTNHRGFISSPDHVLRLGDIVLSHPQLVEDAAVDGISVEEETRSLLEHGINHLLGIHHD